MVVEEHQRELLINKALEAARPLVRANFEESDSGLTKYAVVYGLERGIEAAVDTVLNILKDFGP